MADLKEAIEKSQPALAEAEHIRQEHLADTTGKKLVIIPVDVLRELTDAAYHTFRCAVGYAPPKNGI